MYPLIVSDFDGTLINDDFEIPTSTVMFLDNLRRKKILFVIATGRCLKSVLDYNRDFIFTDYIISSNGAYIYDVVKEKVFYKKNLLITNVKKIVNRFYNQATIYLTDHSTWNLINKKPVYENDYDVIKVDNYEEFINSNKDNIYKIEMYFKELKEAKEAIEEIKNLKLKVKSNLQLNENKYIVEITHCDVDKLEGIKKIANKNKITLNQVLAFGDGYNDLELLQNVGCGVAVDNAVLEVKKAIKETTLDHNHKGVESYLKNIYPQ